ncbi:Hypothetical protein CINCED_3A001667 [Cinara cedri]|uniref:Uncharacterized protein n=1 Tax=Cinara cedri TaxID=506608 RepID=A0A5E4MZK5_9HEMI|nr:Hypothetical protein CINCED_3A001667 [Cinara cedri]
MCDVKEGSLLIAVLEKENPPRGKGPRGTMRLIWENRANEGKARSRKYGRK